MGSLTPYYQDEWVTLYHADCRDLLADLTADVLITDPPYGVRYPGVKNDEDDRMIQAVLGWWGDRPALVFGGDGMNLGSSLYLVWDKNKVGGGTGKPWRRTHELIAVLGRWGTRNMHSAHTVFKDTSDAKAHAGSHPTQKPLDLMRWLILPTEGVILDPFAGSGSTLRAAKDLGRKAVGVEIMEEWCEVAARRLGQEVLWHSPMRNGGRRTGNTAADTTNGGRLSLPL